MNDSTRKAKSPLGVTLTGSGLLFVAFLFGGAVKQIPMANRTPNLVPSACGLVMFELLLPILLIASIAVAGSLTAIIYANAAETKKPVVASIVITSLVAALLGVLACPAWSANGPC